MLESLLIELPARGLQLYQKETPAQVVAYEFTTISKNTYFAEHLQKLPLLLFSRIPLSTFSRLAYEKLQDVKGDSRKADFEKFVGVGEKK